MASEVLQNRLRLAKESYVKNMSLNSLMTVWGMVQRQALEEDEVEIWETAEEVLALLRRR